MLCTKALYSTPELSYVLGYHTERSFWFRIAVSDGGGAAEVYLGKMPNPR
jgi:hypothetical protein